jgi:argininosuccinate lyase
MTERKHDRLWGGRFEREPNAHFDAFQRSFAFDRRLLSYEIAVDRAWAKALEPIGIFTSTEVKQTIAALDKISESAQTDPAWVDSFGANAEDVHHFVEKALVEELGPLGWKLHTGRSRNELVATDFRLFVIDAASQIHVALASLLCILGIQAELNLSVPMAGMTHMQHAQPILLSPATRRSKRRRLPHGLRRASRKFLWHRPYRYCEGTRLLAHHSEQP